MINPYQPPASSLTGAGKSPAAKSSKLWLILGLFFSCLPAIAAMVLVPWFAPVLESFAEDLPMASRWLRDYFLALWTAPILIGVAWLLWPNARYLGAAVTGASIAFAAIAIPLMIYLLYLPIFLLADSA
jgi:hypothetical protein